MPSTSSADLLGKKGPAAGAAIPPGRWQGPHQGKVCHGGEGEAGMDEKIQRVQLLHWSGHHSSTQPKITDPIMALRHVTLT